MKRLGIVGIIIFGISSIVYAGTPGDKGNIFLKLGQGARAIGMGEAYVAVADDISSLYWNPAGLASIEDIGATFMYSKWLADINYNYVAGVLPAEKLDGVLGISVTLLNSGDINRTNNKGEIGGTFNNKDLSLSVSYAKKMRGLLDSVGGTVKYINRTIDDKKSNGFAADIGGLVKPTKRLTLGLSIQNIGPSTKAFVTEKDSLPLTVKAGVSYKLLDDALTLAMDTNFPSDNKANVHLGAEYNLRELLSFRFGYRTDTIKEHGNSSGLTAGFGFKVPSIGLLLDYAVADYGKLGDSSTDTHRISLSFQR